MTEDAAYPGLPAHHITTTAASTDQMHALLEQSAEVILLLDARGVVRYAGPSTARVLGYQPGAIVGTALADQMHPDDRAGATQVLSRLRAAPEGTAEPVTYRLKHQDGSWRALEGVWSNRFADPAIAGIVANTQDVTERVTLESNLRYLAHASKLLSASLDFDTIWASLTTLAVPHIADWCAVDFLTEQGIFEIAAIAHREPEKVALVRAFRQANPISLDDEFGLPAVVKTKERQYFPDISDEMLVSIARTEHELSIVRELGMTSALSVPLVVRDQGIGAITFVTSDSRRRLTEADVVMAEELATRASLALENATVYAEARQAITLRNHFISVASHELKTPITSLKMYTQVLEKQLAEAGNTRLSGYMSKIDTQVGKLTRLVNDLLDVTRLEHGQVTFSVEEFDLAALAREVVEQMRLAAPERTITVEKSGALTITGDRDRIGQVLTNLLTNALKFSAATQPVIVHLDAQDGTVSACVADRGLGIDAEHQARIFERFYRVDDPDERTYPGLGIGLYIANEIITRHGGTMRVISEKGKGSQFSFTLPRNADHPSARPSKHPS